MNILGWLALGIIVFCLSILALLIVFGTLVLYTLAQIPFEVSRIVANRKVPRDPIPWLDTSS